MQTPFALQSLSRYAGQERYGEMLVADDEDEAARAERIAMGARASDTLARSVADKPRDAPIETNVASLRGLADVIGGLVEDANRCAGVDCMGRSVDGVKTWVTRDRFDTIQQRLTRYEAALRAIAGVSTGGKMDMLVDWQGTVTALSATARQALDI